MAHSLVIFPQAMADIRAAVSWLNERSPASAARLHGGLLAAIERLAQAPERHPLAEEAPDLGVELRQVLYGRRRQVYRILFTVEGETVNILRIRHSARERLGPDEL